MIIFCKGWSMGKDGPGQRLIFYLKGCNMACRWCANPESLKTECEILFYPERSRQPVDYVCSHHAVSGDMIDREKCRDCPGLECVRRWKNKCFELAGETISCSEILRISQQSIPMFGDDGGVTFGGGEPTSQIDELCECLKMLKEAGIHTVVESNAATCEFRRIIGLVDYLICDFKADSTDLHRKFTGIDNRQVKENLICASGRQCVMHVRVPLITGLNDNNDEMTNIALFLKEIDEIHRGNFSTGIDVEIIPMHHIGEVKYQALGKEYPMKGVLVPDMKTVRGFEEILVRHGLTVVVT